MIEIAIAVVVTALVTAALMMLPLRMMNIRRLRAWAARDASAIARIDGDLVTAGIIERLKVTQADDLVRLGIAHLDTEAALTEEHGVAVSELEQENAAAQRVIDTQKQNLTALDGNIAGLQVAYAEDKVWANLILRNHAWHIGGKGDPHEKGVTLIRYECACGDVTHAPEGSL